MNNFSSMTNNHAHIILDMDSTLLSIESLDSIIETALSARLLPDAVAEAMKRVQFEMDRGMSGAATMRETIPARIAIAKQLGAPVLPEHFEIVASIVPNTLTKSLVSALSQESISCSRRTLRISVVSGGPQICVNAAVSELQKQMEQEGCAKVHFAGIGNKIVITKNGDLDQLNSRIMNSKLDIVSGIITDPSRAIMIGDGATDVEVYDSGLANYFIAVGLWQRRGVLFKRPDNRPYFRKVDTHVDMHSALFDALEAIRG